MSQVKQEYTIIKRFNYLRPDARWSFTRFVDRKKSTYVTHGYHRYPAKFIPQLVDKLINDYAKKNDIVCDPFGGCGTTLVESKILGFQSIGFDINPVAGLIAKAKVEPINPNKLDKFTPAFLDRIGKIKVYKQKLHPKLKYWFQPKTIRELKYIFASISRIRDIKIRRFFLCGYSHILKNCSVWLMSSIKPTRDKNKIIPDPLIIFKKHINSMVRMNSQYYKVLKNSGNLRVKTRMEVADARNLPLINNSIDLVVTSPPYVTSYEYADLHQLSLYWFKFTDDLSEFRKRFIGTTSVPRYKSTENSLADFIISKLEKRDKALSRHVGNYFYDMQIAIKEMYRVLKPKGYACLILGNTKLLNVDILNAQVAYQQLLEAGFKHNKLIKREISNNIITPWRDNNTGRFTGLKNKNKRRVYQYEYVLITQK